MARNVFALADRLHKTPAEIRREFTLDDYVHFLAYLQLLEEEAR